MTREEIEELKGLAASMGFYDDKNPCKRAVILGNAIQELEQEPCERDVLSDEMTLGQARQAVRDLRKKLAEHLDQEPTIKNDLVVDLIDRAELLKAIDTWDKFGNDPNEGLIPLSTPVLQDRYVPYVKYEDMVNCVKGMPSVVAQEPRWIPCSERLPKVADCYFVTRKIGSYLIVSACFFDGTNTWHNDNRINHERNYLTNIVAWMPHPKPYKSESEE